jgi:hypothetical protein
MEAEVALVEIVINTVNALPQMIVILTESDVNVFMATDLVWGHQNLSGAVVDRIIKILLSA